MTSPMESHCLSFREIPGTTKLFTAYLSQFDRIARYYGHPPDEEGVLAAAREIRLDPAVRGSVVEVLREQNRWFGAGGALDPATAKNLDRLAAGAAAIVTGQQVGLFSGPAYTIYKAISAARWAQSITRRGIDAVPVFWLATEDHDLAEINHVFWNTRRGLERFELPAREISAGRRVGEIKLGEAILPLVESAAESLEGESSGEIARWLRESYASGETYGSAFGKLMSRVFAGRGIIFLDPLDPRLHRLASPVYRRALDESDSLRDALAARSKELEHESFHAQVKNPRESTLLFYNVTGVRHPLRRRNGHFVAGNASFTAAELHAALDRAPEDFTPNVLLRPIVQDSLLPTAAYIGGPAEIAYMAQAQVVYSQLLGRMPAMLPRLSATLVESALSRLMKKYSLDFSAVLRGRQHLRARMELQSLPRGLARRFAADEKVLRRLWKGYLKPLARLDKTLLGARDTAERKMLHQFLKLKARAGRAEALRTGVLDRRERLLLDSLLPNHGLQERSLCFLPFLALYGTQLLDDLSALACQASSQSSSAPPHPHRIVSL
ncbi:MAG: bacillithiol biosynthesis cysteine-adding enzyme BshC [Candidatus Acidiferrales bacterium]